MMHESNKHGERVQPRARAPLSFFVDQPVDPFAFCP